MLRTDEEKNQKRSVSWLELFYDLVFVVVFEGISGGFNENFNPHGFLYFILMFFAVFWVWNASVYYVERFESEGVEIRLFTFLSMLTVTGLAVYSHGGMEKNYHGFVGAYFFARVINMFMWFRAGYYVKKFRPISSRFIYGFIITTSLLIISLFTEGYLRLILFGTAVAVDIITPYFTMKLQAKLPPLSTSKFPERFGLLTIIVLGATIVEIIKVLSSGYHDQPFSFTLKGAMGLFIIFGIWAIYFDFIARRPPKEKITTALMWVYLHLFLLASVTIIGISVSGIMEATKVEMLHMSEDHVLLLTTGVVLLVIALIESILKRSEGELTHRIYSPLLKVVPGIVLTVFSAVSYENAFFSLILCCVGVTVPNIYGMKVLLSRDNEECEGVVEVSE